MLKDLRTIIEKFDPGEDGMIRYRTLFLPELHAIDTLYALAEPK